MRTPKNGSSRLVASFPFGCTTTSLAAVLPHSNHRGPFNRRYVHGYVTGQRYTPPDSTVNPRNGVVSKEILESSEKDRVSRAIDVAELDKE